MKFLIRLLVWMILIQTSCGLSAASSYLLSGGSDTCAINDLCSTAIDLPVVSDEGFNCLQGCTNLATAELFDNDCGIGYSPTVWYKITTDPVSKVLNIHVKSPSIPSLNISLFLSDSGCDQLQSAGLTANNVSCLQGFNGIAQAIGTKIIPNSIYYIAITDVNDIGGTFELCVNTLSFGYNCVQDRNIEITSRASGGPLEGPFEPGETVSICFNVNSYSAADNGCQWFQGLIPFFGNGWNWKSFNADGQPDHATINGMQMGIPGNGMNALVTWDWFTDVDYHFDSPFLQVGDIDHNGTVEMCSNLCDPYCPDLGGVDGSCCSPCWGNPLGTILPGAWFAYGVNGTCPTPGPPIRVDWGDGINCNVMGPWKFCFDLVTRNYPDCSFDHTTNDLTLGFFTTTDAETGSLGGITELCNDVPTFWTPGFHCREYNNDLGTVTLEDHCSGDTVTYELFLPGVDWWEWTVSPSSNVNDTVFEGMNGHILQSNPFVSGSSPVVIKYNLVGHDNGSDDVVFKKLQYRVWPSIQFHLPEEVEICEYRPGKVNIFPSEIEGGKPPYHYLWTPGGDTLSSFVLYSPFQAGMVECLVFDTIGCASRDSLNIKLKPCEFDDMYPEDDPNDTIRPNPTSPHDGNFTFPDVRKYQSFKKETKNVTTFKIHPSPTNGNATIEWSFELQQDATVEIFNLQGFSLEKIPVLKSGGQQKQIDTQSLESGVYFVSLSNGEFRYVTRLVKL